MKTKITTGYVYQVFDDSDECIEQWFEASDQVEYTDDDGNDIAPFDAYQPFEMVDPWTN